MILFFAFFLKKREKNLPLIPNTSDLPISAIITINNDICEIIL